MPDLGNLFPEGNNEFTKWPFARGTEIPETDALARRIRYFTEQFLGHECGVQFDTEIERPIIEASTMPQDTPTRCGDAHWPRVHLPGLFVDERIP